MSRWLCFNMTVNLNKQNKNLINILHSQKVKKFLKDSAIQGTVVSLRLATTSHIILNQFQILGLFLFLILYSFLRPFSFFEAVFYNRQFLSFRKLSHQKIRSNLFLMDIFEKSNTFQPISTSN